MTVTQKRLNWIVAGMGLLFGRQAVTGGFYQMIVLLQAWTAEGVACGFIPATSGGSAANSVVDTDFATWPAVTASSFLAAVGVLESLNTAWSGGYATVAAIKP